MSRFMRGYGRSILGKPAVVAAAVVFRPVGVTLVGSPKAGRRTTWDLRPPAVVNTSTFTASAVRVELTLRTRPRLVSYRLQGPVTVFGASTFRPVETTLVRTPRQAVRAQSKLRPPVLAAIVALARPLMVLLAQQPHRKPVVSKLRPPALTVAGVLARPVQALLTRTPRRPAVSYRLQSPTLVTAAVAVVFRPVAVFLTGSRKPRLVRAKLQPPRVLNPAFIARAVLTKIIRTPRRPFKSRLRLPQVVSAFIQFLDLPFDPTTGHPQVKTDPEDADYSSAPQGKLHSDPQEDSFD